MLILTIINFVLIIAIIIFLIMLLHDIKDINKQNKDEHVILSKNDKKIDKDLQAFYAKQLKITEQINVIINISKTILAFVNSLGKNELYMQKVRLSGELTKLKTLNTSLLAEIAKLRQELKEEKEKRED